MSDETRVVHKWTLEERKKLGSHVVDFIINNELIDAHDKKLIVWHNTANYQLGMLMEEHINSATKEIKETIMEVLDENADLADGDVCTLKKLKDLVPEWEAER